MSNDILLHRRDTRGVHTLTLNNPKAFNVLSEAMLAAFQQAVDAVAADADARVLVGGKASGPRATAVRQRLKAQSPTSCARAVVGRN